MMKSAAFQWKVLHFLSEKHCAFQWKSATFHMKDHLQGIVTLCFQKLTICTYLKTYQVTNAPKMNTHLRALETFTKAFFHHDVSHNQSEKKDMICLHASVCCCPNQVVILKWVNNFLVLFLRSITESCEVVIK